MTATATLVPAGGHPVVEVDPSGRPVAWEHLPVVEGTPALVTVALSGTVYDAVANRDGWEINL